MDNRGAGVTPPVVESHSPLFSSPIKGAVRLHSRRHPRSLLVRGDQHPRQRVQTHLQGDGEDRASEQLLTATGGVSGEQPQNLFTTPLLLTLPVPTTTRTSSGQGADRSRAQGPRVPTDPELGDSPPGRGGVQHRPPAPQPGEEPQHGRPAARPMPSLPHLRGWRQQQLHQRGLN